MTAWPTTDEIAQVLNVDNVSDWETTLDRVRASAISIVKAKRGHWIDGTDQPDDQLAQAALRMAELISTRPGADVNELTRDPTFQGLMFGKRRRFGVS